MSKTIVFFGSGPVAAESLKLLANHFSIEKVVTKSVPEHHKGPAAPVELLSKQLKIPVIFSNSKEELDKIFSKTKFSSKIGIIVDYGVIVSQKVIDYFDFGIINSHFSLLPEWRGADPISFALLSGQSKTGVSLMLIEPTLDTGKLLVRKSLKIDDNDNIVSLTQKLIDFSNTLLVEYLPKYLDGIIKPKRQPHPDRATYSRKLIKADGLIDWGKPAQQIEREFRAYYNWPRSYCTLNGKNIIVTKCHIENNPQDPLDIRCGDKKYFSIDELIAPSGKRMSARDYLNGQK